MNEIDKKILSILQVNADIPIAELSKKVNLSATPCWARINKLYKQGFIKKKVAVVDRMKINLPIIAFVQVRTNQHSVNWMNKFVKALASTRQEKINQPGGQFWQYVGTVKASG